MIDSQAILGPLLDRPAGHGNTDFTHQPRQARRSRRNDQRLVGLQPPAVDLERPQIDALHLVDPADLVQARVLHDAEAFGGQQARHFLPFAKRVGLDDGRGPAIECRADQAEELPQGIGAGRKAVAGLAEGAFDHQDLGLRQFRPFGRGRFAQLEVTRVE